MIKNLITPGQTLRRIMSREIAQTYILLGEDSFFQDTIIDGITKTFLSEEGERINLIIGVDNEGELQYEIPPLGDFNVMDIEVSQLPDQYIKVRFSDPLSKDVVLDGLIYLESREELSWSVNKNVLTVYPKNKLVGTFVVKKLK